MAAPYLGSKTSRSLGKYLGFKKKRKLMHVD